MREISRDEAWALATLYGQAWAGKEDGAALFTTDAVLVERPYLEEGTFSGAPAIASHWSSGLQDRNVLASTLVSLVMDDDKDRGVAKWDARMIVPDGAGDFKALHLVTLSVLDFARGIEGGWRVRRSEEYWQNVPPPNTVKPQAVRDRETEQKKKLYAQGLAFQRRLEKVSLSEYHMSQ
eukprot:Rhum_TRINITY_DN11530_c0_g1::Rhum_TRINITY_DN11530_c0_g1_i1::g.45278::m.45278